VLGITEVNSQMGTHSLAVVDEPLVRPEGGTDAAV
jgi:hypothetical protein